MIKKIIIALLVAMPMSMMAQKFGKVDVENVLTAMPEYTQVQTQLQDASSKFQAELDKLQEEFNKKYGEFQELLKDTATPESIKERRMQELQELDNKIQQFRNSAAQDLQRQQQQLMAPVEQKFQDAIKAVGSEGNFTYISANGQFLFEGSNVEDVTALVKTKLGIK